MVAHGDEEDAFAHLCGIQRDARFGGPNVPTGEKCSHDHRCHDTGRSQAARLKPRTPIPRSPLGQSRSDLPPHALAVILTGIGYGHGIERGENAFHALKRSAAFRALAKMSRDTFASRSLAFAINDQLFFRQVLHPSFSGAASQIFAKARAALAPRGATNGSSERRNF